MNWSFVCSLIAIATLSSLLQAAPAPSDASTTPTTSTHPTKVHHGLFQLVPWCKELSTNESSCKNQGHCQWTTSANNEGLCEDKPGIVYEGVSDCGWINSGCYGHSVSTRYCPSKYYWPGPGATDIHNMVYKLDGQEKYVQGKHSHFMLYFSLLYYSCCYCASLVTKPCCCRRLLTPVEFYRNLNKEMQI